MAAIGITVKDGRFNITMDRFEWTSLTVDGDNIPAEDPGNPQNLLFSYTQEGTGSISFVAKSDNNIEIVNPGNVMTIVSPDGQDKSYVAVLNYTTVSSEVRVQGWLIPVHGIVAGASREAIAFSQGRMTGVFSGEK